MDEDESLCKVETKDGDFYLFTRRLSKDGVGFDLSITDCSSVWEAKGMNSVTHIQMIKLL